MTIRPKAHRLISYMASRNADAGRAVLCTHTELLEAVWPGERRRTQEELAHLVWEIRRKLAPYGAEALLENERGLGYRLHASEPQQAAAAEALGDQDGRASRTRRSRRAATLGVALLIAAGGIAIAVFLTTSGSGPIRMSEFALSFPGSRPGYVTAEADGDLWFTEYDGNRIGRVSASGTITEYPIPTPNAGPEGIAPGPDGNIWFAENQGDKIGLITPSGSIVQFRLPHPNSGPESVVSGPGHAIWFTEDSHRIGRITPAGSLEEFRVPASVVPSDITLGRDGNLWFDSPYTGPGGVRADQRVGRITPTGKVSIFQLPTVGSAPGAITSAGRDIWVAEVEAGKLARIGPSGAVTEFALPNPKSRPADVAEAPDGSVWFTEKAANKIGHITPAGRITEYEIPTANGGPHGIAIAPNGTIWFTEIEASKIGRLRPPTAK